VAFGYGPGRDVVSGLSLTLAPAQTTVILGANGSGKTTICRLASGRLPPMRGVVRAGGSRALARSGLRICAVEDGERHDSGKARADRAPSANWREQVAARLDEDGVLGRQTSNLSAGERQRRSLAFALLVEPDVLILDEPCVHLDAVHQEAMLDLLHEFRTRGGALLLLTARVELARAAANRVGILSRGYVEWSHMDDALVDVRGLQRACLRPSSASQSRSTGTHDRAGPVTRVHTARLATIVRDRLGVDHGVRVVIQQTHRGGRAFADPTVVVSVPDRGPECWVFDGPLTELSPHDLSTALALDPEGQTHVAVH
jgi:ATP-binding cassette subfamily B protein/ATP-binding cassette subfamily C protein